jgi:hypothetical protein
MTPDLAEMMGWAVAGTMAIARIATVARSWTGRMVNLAESSSIE